MDILFVDERNDGASHMAEHYARKAFPACGTYRSAGYRTASTMNPEFVQFAEQHGLDLGEAWPTALESLSDRLEEFDLIVDLDGQARAHLPRIPFHTTVVRWRIDAAAGPQEAYRAVCPKIRELMEMLRGHEAS
jgi:protein-tyrosine-phosphatase